MTATDYMIPSKLLTSDATDAKYLYSQLRRWGGATVACCGEPVRATFYEILNDMCNDWPSCLFVWCPRASSFCVFATREGSGLLIEDDQLNSSSSIDPDLARERIGRLACLASTCNLVSNEKDMKLIPSGSEVMTFFPSSTGDHHRLREWRIRQGGGYRFMINLEDAWARRQFGTQPGTFVMTSRRSGRHV